MGGIGMLAKAYAVLDQLRLRNGLYIASPSEHYKHVWIRDCVYMSVPYLDKYDGTLERTVSRLLDLFQEYAWKIEYVKQGKPKYTWEYLHARYDLEGHEITNEPWGHCQNDSIGAFLFLVGESIRYGHSIIRNDADRQVLQSLVEYLEAVEYWQCPDNGMWEEGLEVHASSIGACVAGLTSLRENTRLVNVPDALIEKGVLALHQMFPRESASKSRDMALLSLVYPYRLFDKVSSRIILRNVEQLARGRGVIRYSGDAYYNVEGEAEWPMGILWLALCYSAIGDSDRAHKLFLVCENVLDNVDFPETFYAGTKKANPNSPLGWCAAMYALAAENVEGKVWSNLTKEGTE